MLHAFLQALQGGQLPGGLRRVLDQRFGPATVDALIGAGLLVPGDPATSYPCPGGGSSCPRDVVANPGDPAFPFVAVPPGSEFCCTPVRLTATDLETWTTARPALAATLSALYGIRGPATLTVEAFPYAHRLGRAEWEGVEREVLLCTNLDGPSPVAFLLARRAQHQPTLVLAHARTRYTSPDVEAHFGSGPVVVRFLEDELHIDRGRIARRQAEGLREPAAPYPARAYCVALDSNGQRALDAPAYRAITASASEYDLFLDLTQTVHAGRHPTSRREGGRAIAGSVTAAQGAAYAELMERGQPLRAAELRALDGIQHPEKFIEAARRELDVRVGRYNWRSTVLLRRDSPEAKRYWFCPPEGLRWVLLRPLAP
jgi:hypothetical protein